MTSIVSVEGFLDEVIVETDEHGFAMPATPEDVVELADDEIDPRLQQLSYSSLLTLHACPRKFQLYRMKAQQRDEDPTKKTEKQVTFDFGHAIGLGIQDMLEGKSLDKAYLNLFTNWEQDILEEDKKRKKSIWLAFAALNRFHYILEQGYLKEYELVYYQGKPASELSFLIKLPNGFKFRGFIDAVLRHKETGAIVVLECKTTASTVINPAMYKNSAQSVGYSVVLDKLFPEESEYNVLYLVYDTRNMTYKEFPFTKTFTMRANWLQDIYLDTWNISTYDEFGMFPMRGESCFNYYRECEYLGLCHMDTSKFVPPLTASMLKELEEEEEKYDFVVTYEELIESQLEKEI